MKTSEGVTQKCLQFGPFRLNPASRTLLHGRARLALPAKAFDTLLVLLEHHGQVVDKNVLMDRVWQDTVVEENNLAQSIAVIRKTLGEQPGERHYVVTVPGRGYSFVAEVREAGPETPAPRRNLPSRAAGLVVAGAILVVACVGLWLGRYNSQPRLVPFTGSSGIEEAPAFSPDGHQIAYAWTAEDEKYPSLYVKVIGAGEPLRLTSGKLAQHPAWSPDGRYIAYYSVPSGIYLIPALGGAERKLAAVKIGGRAAWFPDGKRLAIKDLDPETRFPSIFELSIDTGERRKLTSGLSTWGDQAPALSPDGKTLGFVRWRTSGVAAIYLMPASGGEPRQLTKFEEWASNLAWTPDGREIVYAANPDGFNSLWRVPASGGTPQRVHAAGYNAQGPALAPSGNRLAFVQSTSTVNLRRMELDSPGTPRKLAATTRRQTSPQFSPDGTKLAFSSNRSGWVEIWKSDTEGRNLMQVTSMGALGTFAGTPRWSPDGADIAFDSRPGANPDIYVVSAQGGTPRRITSDPAEDVLPSFSRDGRWIYFTSNRSGAFQIWKVSRAGGDAAQVTSQSGVAAMESPDGKHIYYVNERRPGVWRKPTAGGPETPVLQSISAWKQGTWRRYWGWWTITGGGIIYLDQDFSQQPAVWLLKRFVPQTGATATLAAIPKPPPIQVPCLAVSPDGRTIVYAQVDESTSHIMLLENFR